MRKIKRKIFQFLGVIVWIIGIKYFVEIFNALYDSYMHSTESENIISYMFNNHNFMYNWSQVLVVFIYGLILWALGMIYDAVIKIQEERNKTEINWNNLFSKLEQLEKNMVAPQMGSKTHNSQIMPQNATAWTCPECGHENYSTEMCSICGFSKK